MEIYAKSIITNEQVVLWENSKTLTKFTALLGQWLREKEDLLMRDLWASSVKCAADVKPTLIDLELLAA